MAFDLQVTWDGLQFDNPFLLGSGPPCTNAKVICKAFAAGWGGVVAKTTCLSDTSVVNVVPRYGKLRSPGGDVVGFQNIELISDRPFEDWEDDFLRVKREYPKKILIGSIMERFEEARWQEVAQRCVAAGVDGLELNFSCPHGHPEQGMGAAMGQDPARVQTVTRWVRAVTKVPIWAKLTPNVTDITQAARGAQEGGAHGVSAINTILSVVGIDLQTLRPLPTVEGHSVPGGYSALAVKPIGLRMVREIAAHVPGLRISGMGGIMSSREAIEYLLVGAHTVQVCTGAMLLGTDMIAELCAGLQRFGTDQHCASVGDIIGKSLPYFTTHQHLVELQAGAKALKAASRAGRSGRASHDLAWGERSLQDVTAAMTGSESQKD